MNAELEAFKAATLRFSEAWKHEDGDMIADYPSYLPSFDEFVLDVLAMKVRPRPQPARFKVGDLVEDNEGDKAEVVDTSPVLGVRVKWDCAQSDVESGWIDTRVFNNLSERVRELDGERWTAACRADAIEGEG
jgi:hypothetical protein